MKKKLLTFIIFLIGSTFSIFAQPCTYTQSGLLSSNITFASIITCDNGDVELYNMSSNPGGDGKVTFLNSVTLASLYIEFASGNKPIEFIIPEGVTVTITNSLVFSGQADKDKFLTVEGELIIGGTLNLGNLEFEIDGNGSINADSIIGAGDTTCEGVGTCPGIITNTCGGGGLCLETSIVILPIELTYFQAYTNKTNITLNWQTATELNNDYFTLQRSADGVTYEIIGTVMGAGTSMSPINYTYTDTKPLSGVSYYRLKQTDYDGAFEIFSPVSVSYLNESEINIGSDPIAKELIIHVNGEMGLGVAKIYNVIGVLIKTIEISDNFTTVNVSDIPKGTYILVVSADKTQITKKIMVQ